MKRLALLLALVVFATPVCGQQPPKDTTSHAHDSAAAGQAQGQATLPDGWQMRLDNPEANAASIAFTTMAPGWHVTTGPAAIFWNPEHRVSGEFSASSTIFLFKSSGPREGYGIFVGGEMLGDDNKGQSYVYFLLRGDGRYLIKRRNGPVTTTIKDWTEHAAVARLPTGDEPAKNVLAIDVVGDMVNFSVNGARVESLPRSDFALDGQVGLRVNHRLNLHVGDLTVAQKDSGGR